MLLELWPFVLILEYAIGGRRHSLFWTAQIPLRIVFSPISKNTLHYCLWETRPEAISLATYLHFLPIYLVSFNIICSHSVDSQISKNLLTWRLCDIERERHYHRGEWRSLQKEHNQQIYGITLISATQTPQTRNKTIQNYRNTKHSQSPP